MKLALDPLLAAYSLEALGQTVYNWMVGPIQFQANPAGRFPQLRDTKIKVVRADGNSFYAKIAVGPYQGYVEQSGSEEWRGGCNCPLDYACEHMVAAALQTVLLFHEVAPQSFGRTPLVQRALETAARLGWRTGASDTEVRLLNTLQKAQLGHSAVPKEQIHVIRTLVEQFGLVLRGHESALNAIFDALALFVGSRVRISTRDRLVITNSAPNTPEQLLSLIMEFMERQKIPAPAVLLPLVDLDWARSISSKTRRQFDIEEWKQRFALLERDSERVHSVQERAGVTRIRLKLSKKKLLWEQSVAAGPFIPMTADDAKNAVGLSREGTISRASASRTDFDPPTSALLTTLRKYTLFETRSILQLGDQEDMMVLSAVLRHPHACECVVDIEGRQITHSPRRLVWLVTEVENNDVLVDLRFEDGGARPERLLIISKKPPMYLDTEGSQWFDGQPPPDEQAGRVIAAIIPREVLQHPEAGKFAARSGIALPPSLAGKFKLEKVIPVIRAWIRNQSTIQGPSEVLTLSLTAISADGRPRLRWADGTWQSIDLQRDSNAVLDWHALAPVAAHFDSYPHQNYWGGGEKIPDAMDAPDFPNRFSNWIKGFPAWATVELSPELNGLLRGPTVARYSLDLKPSGGRSGVDWFDLKLVLNAEDTTLTAKELELLRASEGRWVRLKGGWRQLKIEGDSQLQGRLKELGVVPNQAESLMFHSLQLADTMQDVVDEKVWRQICERASTLRKPLNLTVPPTLTATLRPYQHEGFEFLAFLSENGLGGILADDMGLGKTIEAITWLLWLKANRAVGEDFRVLVVAPKSVQPNWALETRKFAPSLTTSELLARPNGESVPATNLVIINYAQLRSKAEVLRAIEWDAVILDEGQNIKNPTSLSAQTACSLKSRNRLVLTGTPVENRSTDLWSLFRFAMPGLLGNQTQFRRLYDDYIPETLHRLRIRVRHFMLRRTKGQVAKDLPEKVEEDILCDLSQEQRMLYDAEYKKARAMLSKVETKGDFDRSRFHILASILRMRQICCHPRLIPNPADDWAADETCSAKFEALLERVEEIVAEGHKVLIFSQFLDMLSMISAALKKRAIGHLKLTGETENRQALVDQFQSDPLSSAFLISLRAGGSGLNLTAASYVVLFDPWWNPAVESQAIDRTHRIGQTNRVNAYRLIARNTIEEKIRTLQKDKAEVAGVIVQEEDIGRVLDLESIRKILA